MGGWVVPALFFGGEEGFFELGRKGVGFVPRGEDGSCVLGQGRVFLCNVLAEMLEQSRQGRVGFLQAQVKRRERLFGGAYALKRLESPFSG